MKKILFISNISNRISNFSLSSIYASQNLGYEFHMAANYSNFNDNPEKYGVKLHHIDLDRNPFSKQNITAYKQMLELIKEEKFDVIHCNTPIGGVLGRLCGKKAGVPKVIYTAHGFHFYDGAPIKNWIIYFGVEWWLSRYTDILVTINKEDYNLAKKHYKNCIVKYMPGVGLDIDKFRSVVVDRKTKRDEIGVPQDSFVVLSVGELNKNKNHEVVIRAIAKLNNSNIHYVICGKGPHATYLNKLTNELGIGKNVHLLGFRSDIAEICKSSDVFAFPSLREGLGMAAIEAMATGLPIITSNVHGINDYSINGATGFSCSPSDVSGFAMGIKQLENNIELRINIGRNNVEVAKDFDIKKSIKEITRIYREAFRDD